MCFISNFSEDEEDKKSRIKPWQVGVGGAFLGGAALLGLGVSLPKRNKTNEKLDSVLSQRGKSLNKAPNIPKVSTRRKYNLPDKVKAPVRMRIGMQRGLANRRISAVSEDMTELRSSIKRLHGHKRTTDAPKLISKPISRVIKHGLKPN